MNTSAIHKASVTKMKKALIIDDEPIINRLNKKILSNLEINSDCRNNLDCFEKESVDQLCSYDLLIIDLNLIRQNGGKILTYIKSRHETLPILITSGYLKESAQEYLSQFEKIDYIQKPYTMEDFKTQVKNLLEA